MQLTSAIVTAAAKYGSKALVLALGGDEALGGAVGDVLAGFRAEESQLNARLDRIEAQLDEALEQRYIVGLRTGSRYLSDAMAGPLGTRDDDLQRARASLTEAAAAARSALQRAEAERHLLICYLMIGRRDLAVQSLIALECAALAAALTAFSLPYSRDATLAFMRRQKISTTGWGASDRMTAAAGEVSAQAERAAEITHLFLSECAPLAEALELPVRATPRMHGRRWEVDVDRVAGARVGPLTVRFPAHSNFTESGKLRISERTPSLASNPKAVEIAADPVFDHDLWAKSHTGFQAPNGRAIGEVPIGRGSVARLTCADEQGFSIVTVGFRVSREGEARAFGESQTWYIAGIDFSSALRWPTLRRPAPGSG